MLTASPVLARLRRGRLPADGTPAGARPDGEVRSGHALAVAASGPATETNATVALLATGVHAVSYLAVTAFIALLVFEKLGVGILRRAWFNLDLIRTGALVATGAATLMM